MFYCPVTALSESRFKRQGLAVRDSICDHLLRERLNSSQSLLARPCIHGHTRQRLDVRDPAAIDLSIKLDPILRVRNAPRKLPRGDFVDCARLRLLKDAFIPEEFVDA